MMPDKPEASRNNVPQITQVVATTTVPEGTIQPYLGQLQIVRTGFRFGDERSVLTAMNPLYGDVRAKPKGVHHAVHGLKRRVVVVLLDHLRWRVLALIDDKCLLRLE